MKNQNEEVEKKNGDARCPIDGHRVWEKIWLNKWTSTFTQWIIIMNIFFPHLSGQSIISIVWVMGFFFRGGLEPGHRRQILASSGNRFVFECR